MVEAGGQAVVRRHPCNQWSRSEIVWPRLHDRPWGCGRGVDWTEEGIVKSLQTMGRSRAFCGYQTGHEVSQSRGNSLYSEKDVSALVALPHPKAFCLQPPASSPCCVLYPAVSDNSLSCCPWHLNLPAPSISILSFSSSEYVCPIINPHTSTLHKATRVWLKKIFIYHILCNKPFCRGLPLSLGQWPWPGTLP